MRIFHLSGSTRYTQDGKPNNGGGVEKYGWYLHRATGCHVVTSLPGNLNSKTDLVVADFHHTNNVPENIVAICFIHGSMAELARRVDKVSDFRGVIDAQHRACSRPNTYYIAASPSAAYYARQHHGLAYCPVIEHGVDSSLFKPADPLPPKPPWIVLHAATDYVKNQEKIVATRAALNELYPDMFKLDFLDARIDQEPERFRRGHLFVHESWYEGNSFACLEAAMTGLPLVVSESGLFDLHDREDTRFGEILPREASATEYAQMIRRVADSYEKYQPRKWALEHADYERFADQWTHFLNSIAAERGIA